MSSNNTPDIPRPLAYIAVLIANLGLIPFQVWALGQCQGEACSAIWTIVVLLGAVDVLTIFDIINQRP